MRCYADKGLKKGKTYCDINFKSNDTDDKVNDRIACYESIPLSSKAVCNTIANRDAESDYKTWNPINATLEVFEDVIENLLVCYKALGYDILDE